MTSFYQQLPKAELHLHLEGSVAPETLCELDSSLSLEQATARYRYRDFPGFLQTFKWVMEHLNAPEDYALVARRLLEELGRQNVSYAEINLSAGVSVWRKQDFAAIYEAVKREAERSEVEVWWILDAVRHFGAEAAMEVARLAVERAGDRVVAFGIGGDEARGPAAEFRGVFAFAAAHGLKLVPHAGEAVGPESVWAALELGASRIGHGIRSVEDETLLRHLRDHQIPLEICISSNVATGAVASLAAHPVRRLFDANVPIVLNTDDPAMFHTDLSREYELAATQFGFSREELEQLARDSFKYAFRSCGRPDGSRPMFN